MRQVSGCFLQNSLYYLSCCCDCASFYARKGFDPAISGFGSSCKRMPSSSTISGIGCKYWGTFFALGADSQWLELFPPVYTDCGCLLDEGIKVFLQSSFEILPLNSLVASQGDLGWGNFRSCLQSFLPPNLVWIYINWCSAQTRWEILELFQGHVCRPTVTCNPMRYLLPCLYDSSLVKVLCILLFSGNSFD